MIRTKYLIIGNSAGGIGAAEAIRDVDKTGSITIVSDEPCPSYSRPLISKYLAGERNLERILFRPTEFYTENNIVSLLGERVNRLQLESHLAELDNRKKITWEKLLLAPGGIPIVPKIKGIDKTGVFTFTTLNDAKAIHAFLDSATKAVVIGGGLIGVSVTEALMKRGIEVTIVEMKDRLLNTILDDKASLIAEEAFKQAGIRIITGQTATEIAGNYVTEGTTLNNGERIPCDLIVVAIGVLPRIELVRGTEIEINHGIVVDRCMATNHPNVYSCGDVAEAYDFILGTNRLTPIWPNAYLGGRIAGYNMAGVPAEYPGGTAVNSLNYFGLDIVSAGVVAPPDEETYEIINRQNGDIYQKVVLKSNLVTGMVFVKDIGKSGIVFGLMRDRVNVGSFKQELLREDFGLVSLPREIWQEQLETVSSRSVTQPAVPTEAVEDFAGE